MSENIYKTKLKSALLYTDQAYKRIEKAMNGKFEESIPFLMQRKMDTATNELDCAKRQLGDISRWAIEKYKQINPCCPLCGKELCVRYHMEPSVAGEHEDDVACLNEECKLYETWFTEDEILKIVGGNHGNDE
jgi:hypothetical protein